MGRLGSALSRSATCAPTQRWQYIVPGFEDGLASWPSSSGYPVRVARDGELVGPGQVLLAPAHQHLGLLAGMSLRVRLRAATVAEVVPSADVLFESAVAPLGARALSILLFGMGSDGTRGLLALSRSGGTTVTQAGATCVVDGMPASARELGASQYELSPREIGDLIARVHQGGALPSPFQQ